MSQSAQIPGLPIGQLLTVEDVAKRLKVSVRTTWRLNSSGRMPRPVKVGGGVRWREADIQKWINEGCPHFSTRDNDNRR